MERIINMTEASAISESDYIVIDSPTLGTRKYLAANLSGGGGGGGEVYTDLFTVKDSELLTGASSFDRTYTVTEDGVYLVGLVWARKKTVSSNSITGDFTTLYDFDDYINFCVKVISADANTDIIFSAVSGGSNTVKYFVVKINLDITTATELYSQYLAADGNISYDPSSLVVAGKKALIIQIANFDGNSGEVTCALPSGVMASYLSLFYNYNINVMPSQFYSSSNGVVGLLALDDLSNVTSIYTRGGSWGTTGLIILDLN